MLSVFDSVIGHWPRRLIGWWQAKASLAQREERTRAAATWNHAHVALSYSTAWTEKAARAWMRDRSPAVTWASVWAGDGDMDRSPVSGTAIGGGETTRIGHQVSERGKSQDTGGCSLGHAAERVISRKAVVLGFSVENRILCGKDVATSKVFS